MSDALARKELVLNLFTTACEGGINYWADIQTYRWSDGSGGSDPINFEAEISEFEDGKDHKIDKSVILKGIKLAGDKEVLDKYSVYALKETAMAYRYGGDKLEELDYDASTADAIVQLGLFGEIIYG